MDTPQYIGPYSADYYDNLYGANNLFTPASDTPATDTPFLSKWDPTGWALDLIVFISIVLLIAGVSYFLIKKTSK